MATPAALSFGTLLRNATSTIVVGTTGAYAGSIQPQAQPGVEGSVGPTATDTVPLLISAILAARAHVPLPVAVLSVLLQWGPLLWLWACPAVMHYLLQHVTGIDLAERLSLASRGDDYRGYQSQVSRFMPMPSALWQACKKLKVHAE